MKIIFKGIVQGVGFRPTVYRVAKNLGLHGYVLNKGSEVEVVIDKNKDEFLKEIKSKF
jgi:hydrogenase maturation protein HypF